MRNPQSLCCKDGVRRNATLTKSSGSAVRATRTAKPRSVGLVFALIAAAHEANVIVMMDRITPSTSARTITRCV